MPDKNNPIKALYGFCLGKNAPWHFRIFVTIWLCCCLGMLVFSVLNSYGGGEASLFEKAYGSFDYAFKVTLGTIIGSLGTMIEKASK